jgi:pyruvate dehydrogenase (quinone)
LHAVDEEAQMSQTVAGILVDVLEQIGVKHIFGLIGDSLNLLADAIRRSDIAWIGVRHEEGAALGGRRPSETDGSACGMRRHDRSRQRRHAA